ncbi:MAG: hypothetical protein WD448_05910 [Woeseia sp.]
MLTDPGYRPPQSVIDRLNHAVASEVVGRKQTEFRRGERPRISETIGIQAAFAALAPLRSHMTLADANQMRRNQSGYDLIVDDRVRIQVKCGTYVDSIGLAHTWGKPDAADLDYDVLFLVDAGVMLNPRPAGTRPDGRSQIPIKNVVDFYIVPNEEVRRQVALGRHVNRKGAQLYLYKRIINSGTKEFAGQWLDLVDWHNRWDVMDRALLKSG